MAKFKIEKGIPLSKVQYKGEKDRRISPLKKALMSMENGDSLFLPRINDENPHRQRSRLGAMFTTLRPKQWVTRTVTENGKDGVRIWRIS
jgi:hypothetical protein